MSLPASEHYEIITTPDPEHEGLIIYGVQNKETEVVEYYDNLLPRTWQAMMHSEEKYDEMLAAIAGGTNLTLVPNAADTTTDNTSH